MSLPPFHYVFFFFDPSIQACRFLSPLDIDFAEMSVPIASRPRFHFPPSPVLSFGWSPAFV
jgi:hypothetical protein